MPEQPKIQFTPAQAAAIKARGGSLLVSAAAGSGKTRVLVERVVGLITDPEHPADADSLLIMTFTNAAAAKLRADITAQEVRAHPGDLHLRSQQLLLQRASIGTVDAFCLHFVQQHFAMLDVPPDFTTAEEADLARIEQETLAATLETAYQDADFRAFADLYDRGRTDSTAGDAVLDLYHFTRALPHPAASLTAFAEMWQQEAPPQQTEWGRELLGIALARAQGVKALLDSGAAIAARDEKADAAYTAVMLDDAARVENLCYHLEQGDWDKCLSALELVLSGWRAAGRIKGGKDANQSAAAASELRDRAKKQLESLRRDALLCTAEEFAADRRRAAPLVAALVRVTQTFADNCFAAKCAEKVLDYADYEHLTLDLLVNERNERTPLCRTVSSRYTAVLVDEYQDTNALQDAIYFALARPEADNLFFVGDIKQSIYRFRLAEPGIFLEKYRTYADADHAAPGAPRRRVLSRNFRSRREVLAAANFVFAALMSREMGELDYTEEQHLHFGAEYYPEVPRETEFHYLAVEDTPEQRFDRAEAEARFVAKRIRRMLDEGFTVRGEDGTMRPAAPEDIVILMRSPSARQTVFAAALAREGIPCDGGESEDFFSAMEVAVVLSLLEVVDNPRQDVPLIAVLRSPLVGMSADRLAEIRAVQREGDYYEALRQDEGEDAQAFLSLLHELRQVARELSADKLLWYIYDRCRVQAIFGAMEDGTARQARLRALYDYIRRLVQGGRTSLFDCVRQVRQLLESGDAPAITAAGAAGGVRLMSVHKSKGLEFPVVFLADLNRSFNRQDLDRPVLVHPQLGVGAERVEVERRLRYDTVSKTALALTLEREAKAEELRILYVAMTRAQEKLIMVCSRKNPDKHLKELCALAELPAPPEAVAAVNCPGDWLLLALLSTYQAGVFHDYTGVRPAVLYDGPEGLTMRLHRIGGEEDGGAAMPAEEPEAQAPDPQPDEAALAFRYSHRAATVTPSKVTATQLKGRAIDQEIAEGTLPARRTAAPEKPRFLQEKRGLTGAERGTAMHLAMQFLPLDTPAVPEAVTAFAETLTARRLLTPEQAAALDIPALARFLASSLAERIRTAPQVWREYRFALLTDAGIYDVAAAGEEILLQGVADCVFETTAGLTVVDFKTDRVTAAEASQRAEAYRPQLDAYAGALSRILEKPVTERILYFFACGEEISL